MWHKWLLLFILSIQPLTTEALQLSVMLGPQMETYNKSDEEGAGRSSFTAFQGELEEAVQSRWSLALGVSSQTNLASMSIIGFGVMGTLRYYFSGMNQVSSFSSDDVQLAVTQKYGFFAGFGGFQKFLSFQTLDDSVQVGGLMVSGGGFYNLDERYYLQGVAQYLMSGMGQLENYTSIELYIGAGMRF